MPTNDRFKVVKKESASSLTVADFYVLVVLFEGFFKIDPGIHQKAELGC